MCSATGYPVAERPAYTGREIGYPADRTQSGGDWMQFHQLKRREFIMPVGGAVAWPRAARAQQGERIKRIGVLNAIPADCFHRKPFKSISMNCVTDLPPNISRWTTAVHPQRT
jgi:hypothetical protein